MVLAPVQMATQGLAVRTTALLAAVAVESAPEGLVCASMAGRALTAHCRCAAMAMESVPFQVCASATRAGWARSARSRRCVLIPTALAMALASSAAVTVLLAGRVKPAN